MQAVRDLLQGRAHRPRAARGRQRIGHVVAGQPADGHRKIRDVEDLVLLRPVPLHQAAAVQHVRQAAGTPVTGEERGSVRVHREVGDLRADAAGHRGDQGVVGVEDHPAVGLRHPADRALDLGQLRERMDSAEIEVVGGDVGEDRRLVGLVAQTPQDETAARGLQHRHIHVAAPQDLGRAAGSGPVAGVHQPLVHEDPVRGGRAHVVARAEQDVGDEPGDGGLAVGAGDRDHGHAPGIVADPGRRRRRGRGYARRPRCERPGLRVGQADAAARGDGPGGEVEGGLRDRPGPFGARPRPGDDPAARVGRAVHLDRARVLVVVRAEAPGPGHHIRHGIWPLAGGRRPAEVDQRRVARRARTGPGPGPAHGNLDLDGRQEPVDVGSLEQPDLDESHRPARIRERGPCSGGSAATVHRFRRPR